MGVIVMKPAPGEGSEEEGTQKAFPAGEKPADLCRGVQVVQIASQEEVMRPEENKPTTESFHASSSEQKKTSAFVRTAEIHHQLTHHSRPPTSDFAFASHSAWISPIQLIQHEQLQVPKPRSFPPSQERISTPGWAGSFPFGG